MVREGKSCLALMKGIRRLCCGARDASAQVRRRRESGTSRQQRLHHWIRRRLHRFVPGADPCGAGSHEDRTAASVARVVSCSSCLPSCSSALLSTLFSLPASCFLLLCSALYSEHLICCLFINSFPLTHCYLYKSCSCVFTRRVCTLV